MTVHIATSEDLGGVVRHGLREPVCSFVDNLLVGPCSATAQDHVRARCEYWGLHGRERTRFFGSFRAILRAVESPERVLVWTSRPWADRAALWALCAWRLGAWPTAPNMACVVLGEPAEEDANELLPQYTRIQPADARQGMDQARSLSLTRIREMARVWRRLAAVSPILAHRGRRPAPARRPLVALGAYQAGFFPRLAEHGPILSRFDELLFSCVGERWSTPLDVFASRGADGEELRRWLALTGDVFLASRLAQWASHRGDEAALDCEPCPTDNFMKAARYRLSSAGQGILREGLSTLDRGARLPVWGAMAYDPGTAWVVVNDLPGQPRLRRLEELPAPDVERGASPSST